MGNLIHRNNASKDKIIASNVLMGQGNNKTDTVEKRIRDLEESGGGGGSDVEVTPLLHEGVHIADIKVNGETSELYAPEGGGQGTVTDVKVNGQSVVDQYGEAEIDLTGKQDTIVAGQNIQIAQDGKTISATDTTYSDFIGATSQQDGSSGLVPSPLVTDKDKFLKGDGTWGEAGGGNVDDVVMNGQSIVDSNKVASFNNYVELTRSEYDALPDTKYTDGILYCIKDGGATKGNYFAPIIHSLAEREVGVWTDGKPLYQKNIYKSYSELTTYGFMKGFRLNEDDATKQIVRADAMAYSASYGRCFLGCRNYTVYDSSTNFWWCGMYYSIIVVAHNTSSSFLDTIAPDIYATIWYTKTTDNPGTGKWTTSGVPAHHYSTDEQVIGTWIDGSTLYEKTFSFNQFTYGDWFNMVDLTTYNISNMVNIQCTVKRNDANGLIYTFNGSMMADGTSYRVTVRYYNKNLQGIITGYNDFASMNVTVQYTKSS